MLKKYLTAGLLLWIPLAITVWVLESFIRWSDSILLLLPPQWRPENLFGFHIPGIGLVIGLLFLLASGALVANFIGQWFVRRWEQLLVRIPIVRPVYSGVKQILETILSDRTQSFKEVVLIEFPRTDCWTYAFVVSTPHSKTLEELGSEDMVNVYVPTAPNPTSGYVLLIERKKLRKTEASIEDAFKFHVSLGVMPPSYAKVKHQEMTQKTE